MTAVGVFGGTFDPIHLGHLLLAEQAGEALGLTQVLFVPTSDPPHKGVRTPASHRFAMVVAAIAGNPRFAVSRIEIDRPGKSFTVDTLEELHRSRPGHDWVLLLGADSLADLPNWRLPERIAELCRFAVYPREGFDLPTVVATLPPFARQRVATLEAPLVHLASRQIRATLRAGKSVRYMVPDRVREYILEHDLRFDA